MTTPDTGGAPAPLPQRITEHSGSITASIDAHTFEVTILRAAVSTNGYTYPPNVLAAATPLFNGATAFADHANSPRSVRDVAGSYDMARFENDAIRARLRLIDPNLARLAETMLADAVTGRPTPNVGLSVDIQAIVQPDRTISEILAVNSVDVVYNPSAGGSFDRLIENTRGTITMPSQDEALITETSTTTAPVAPVSSPDNAMLSQIQQHRLALCSDVLHARLALSNLPQPAVDYVTAQYADRLFESTDLDATITAVRAMLGAATASSTVNAPTTTHAHLTTPADRLQIAMDMLMGNKITEAQRQGTPQPQGIRELFSSAGFDGHFGWERRITEADEITTAIMANIVGVSMNKRLVADYADQPKWWAPIVTQVPVRDMKQQIRIKLNDFASIPTVEENAAYVNLPWDDTAETYTPAKRGSIAMVTLETILNDDLRAVQSIPKKLARAAGVTINEFVANMFLANGGEGATMADTYHVFNTTAHQGNLGSAALDSDSLTAALIAISKTADTASKRMGLVGKWLLVPPDLQFTAWTLAYSTLRPGTADNDANPLQGLVTPIVVPQFTDTNNWYLLADPSQAEVLELGFLNGNDVPELLVQNDPSSGTVFTNDAISYKLRWIFGGGVVDYHGAYGAIVV